MRSLLEFRDKIKYGYRKYEFLLLPTLKFMLAYLVLCCVNGTLGYMSRIDSPGITLMAALLCSFLPSGWIVFVASVFSLLHMYTLSLEAALVGVCVYLIMLLVFVRFDSRHVLLIVLTGICAAMKIPCIIPIAVGLLTTPGAAISVGCGLISHGLIKTVAANAAAINSMGTGEEMAKIRLLLDGLLKNSELHVTIVAFTVTIAVVYVIRRLSVDYSWSIAMVTGAILNVVVILAGDLLYDTNVSLFGTILVSILALAIAKVIEFMCFGVDYSRTENVQFEDDEYYYYVKAVPKMTVAVQSKTVKKINSQRNASHRSGASSQKEQRSVVTEYAESRRAVPHSSAGRPENGFRHTPAGGKSVTIGKYENGEEFEEFEDLD